MSEMQLNLPVLICTDHGELRSDPRFETYRRKQMLVKPVDPEDLVNPMRILLEGGS